MHIEPAISARPSRWLRFEALAHCPPCLAPFGMSAFDLRSMWKLRHGIRSRNRRVRVWLPIQYRASSCATPTLPIGRSDGHAPGKPPVPRPMAKDPSVGTFASPTGQTTGYRVPLPPNKHQVYPAQCRNPGPAAISAWLESYSYPIGRSLAGRASQLGGPRNVRKTDLGGTCSTGIGFWRVLPHGFGRDPEVQTPLQILGRAKKPRRRIWRTPGPSTGRE
ncbi:hypothetical protein BT67DRAFT_251412 [Trichocladium antarcticum]|uniref:Uncharacterized protein n=1 Tax=Trichocladium antarcticum TaxID=1450529 RepID=A0AAN6UBK8_9PEZI|nr:hypothetical protein BT67DRAFT_251412 [Trichocladium antarcticum]